jgi:hypothetical protein
MTQASLSSRMRDQLIELARQKRTATYFELARAIDFSLHDDAHREAFATALRAVSSAENASGRPMLSALVVLLGNGRPGTGFFNLAQELGAWDGNDPATFHEREVARVWAEWAKG